MAILPFISALASFIKIEIGIVSVFIAMLPAKVKVAPNSPKAFAQVRIRAENKPCFASGRVIVKKACLGVAPKVLATCSNLVGICSMVVLTIRVAIPKMVTNCAMTIPQKV